MPNVLNASGLQTATQAELQAQYIAAFQAIYGSDIDLSSSTPDAQMIMTFIQSVLDVEDLLTQVYSSFDPDNAIGVTLDQRVAINGIQRQAGTYTIQPVSVTVSTALTLWGLDQSSHPVFTVQDNAGNEYEIETTQNPPSAGTYSYNFQAAGPGAIRSALNSITTPVTIVLGVSSVNNPTTFISLGLNEETDAALKIRRQQSVSLASQGYLAGLEAALLNVNGVTSVQVIENNTNALVPPSPVPGHSIWVIVAGSGASASIANAIYLKRNAGCGMYGSISYTITQLDGTAFNVYWDEVTQENVFIKFTASSINGTAAPQIAAIIAGLSALFVPGVNAIININQLAAYVQDIDPNTLVTGAGFSTSLGGSYTHTLLPTAPNYQFVISPADTIITPIILSPATVAVAPLGTQLFTPLGGYGPYSYSMSSNPSGGSINSSTGLYTAGSTGLVTDVALVTDSLSNTATATITVT